MEIISPSQPNSSKLPASYNTEQASPFSQERVTITKEEQINLIHQANYWQAQHAQLKQKNRVLEDEVQYLKAKIKDLKNCLFGKKSKKKQQFRACLIATLFNRVHFYKAHFPLSLNQ